ncbi:MAG: 3-phosphoshikimate 1-carboxyvinyltransferase [Clostridia bacterium]|nr:3-phosphoshikimate 1-carboxyvinyltransferase [Clostridia bacterium]
MNARIFPGKLAGRVEHVIASKSQTHRALICAALADKPTALRGRALSRDIEATLRCLRALGAEIASKEDGFFIEPIRALQRETLLDCGESGSTLRFLLPLTAALGADCSFTGQGNLASRPLSPLYEEMQAHGVMLSPQGRFPLCCRGRLRPGDYRIAGNISSQFISGLLLALPLLPGDSRVTVEGPLASRPYVELTRDMLRRFGIRIEEEFHIPGGQRFISPGALTLEGDWSAAACWLAAGALSEKGVFCEGLCRESIQGDRAIVALLQAFGAQTQWRQDGVLVRRGDLHGIDIDAADIPDLVPVLSVVAALARGETRIRQIGRLRYKESDRVQAILRLLHALAAEASTQDDTLIIQGRGRLPGGLVDGCQDHRIVMAAAVAATAAEAPVTLLGAEAADKSDPGFWDQFAALGGHWEEADDGI